MRLESLWYQLVIGVQKYVPITFPAETAKELFSQNEVELEVIEQMGINSSNLQPGFSGEEEENYIPEDEDREGEGLDDFDDSGDYREG